MSATLAGVRVRLSFDARPVTRAFQQAAHAMQRFSSACSSAFAQGVPHLAGSVPGRKSSPRQRATAYACSMQTELRTPPSEWTCTPSPRLFGLDRGAW